MADRSWGVRRWLWVAAAVVVAAPCAAVAAPVVVPAAAAPPEPRVDPRPLPAPLLGQRGPDLRVVLRTGRRPVRLDAGNLLCVDLTLARSPLVRRVCAVGGQSPRLRVRLGSRVRETPLGRPDRPGRWSLRLTVPGAELGLTRSAILAVRSRELRPEGDRGVERASRIVALQWRAWRVTGCQVPGAGLARSGPPGGDTVGLSFDDGPAAATPAVLDMLRAAGMHATFYVIGRQVSWYPQGAALMRRALAEGDMLGNHSWQHAVLPAAPSIVETQAGIVAATGFTPCTFRPPFGRFDPRLGADVAALGMRPVTWDIDTRDWTLPGSAAIAAAALKARPGDIILMHDGGGPRTQTVTALSAVLAGLRARGLRGVTVEDLLGAMPAYRYG